LNIPQNSVLSFVFPGPVTMRKINRNFLNHDYLTDVICFNYAADDPNLDDDDIAVEIFISPDIAMQRSDEDSNLNYAEEMVLYSVHGVLHATGMLDGTPHQKAQMRTKENNILAKLKEVFVFSEIFPKK